MYNFAETNVGKSISILCMCQFMWEMQIEVIIDQQLQQLHLDVILPIYTNDMYQSIVTNTIVQLNLISGMP